MDSYCFFIMYRFQIEQIEFDTRTIDNPKGSQEMALSLKNQYKGTIVEIHDEDITLENELIPHYLFKALEKTGYLVHAAYFKSLDLSLANSIQDDETWDYSFYNGIEDSPFSYPEGFKRSQNILVC